jgi:xanthine dehydrogenase YagT iron-sulfur-binding subunit
VDGERINSCFALAIQYDGRKITTIEGLADADGLHPLQSAFIKRDGFQCGYCTPGQICSAAAMIGEFQSGSPNAVTEDPSECASTLRMPRLRSA